MLDPQEVRWTKPKKRLTGVNEPFSSAWKASKEFPLNSFHSKKVPQKIYNPTKFPPPKFQPKKGLSTSVVIVPEPDLPPPEENDSSKDKFTNISN